MVLKSTVKARKKRELAKLEAVRQQAFCEGYQQAEKDTKATAAIPEYSPSQPVQEFSSGATRDLSHDKLDYEGFLSPEVLEAFAMFMHANRTTNAGFRGSDNWQAGIPIDVYMKSLWRHFHAVWKAHRRHVRLGGTRESYETQLVELMAMQFNVQGYAHELIMQHLGASGLEAFSEVTKRARDLDLAKRRKTADRA